MPFAPDDYAVPTSLETTGFRLEALGPQHNARDHQAWMSSIDHIRATPGYAGRDWPAPMTPEQNLADLEQHAWEFEQRRGFTYTVLDGDDVVGCVYIYPADDGLHDARATSWVTEARADLDPRVRATVKAWLATSWPFELVDYAGT